MKLSIKSSDGSSFLFLHRIWWMLVFVYILLGLQHLKSLELSDTVVGSGGLRHLSGYTFTFLFGLATIHNFIKFLPHQPTCSPTQRHRQRVCNRELCIFSCTWYSKFWEKIKLKEKGNSHLSFSLVLSKWIQFNFIETLWCH